MIPVGFCLLLLWSCSLPRGTHLKQLFSKVNVFMFMALCLIQLLLAIGGITAALNSGYMVRFRSTFLLTQFVCYLEMAVIFYQRMHKPEKKDRGLS